MIEDPYSASVRALFAQPAHAGDLDHGVSAYFEGQGVRLYLAAATAGGTIAALRFRAFGCPHLIAAAEAFCARYEGRPAADLQGFSALTLMQSLPVPAAKTGRILVLEDAAKMLGQKLLEENSRNASNCKDIRD